MKMNRKTIESVTFLEELLKHLELLIREDLPLSQQEVTILRSLEQTLPKEIGLVNGPIASRIRTLLKRSANSGKNASAVPPQITLPRSDSTEPESVYEKLDKVMPQCVRWLTILENCREKRLMAPSFP